jgi:hypothetical protein
MWYKITNATSDLIAIYVQATGVNQVGVIGIKANTNQVISYNFSANTLVLGLNINGNLISGDNNDITDDNSLASGADNTIQPILNMGKDAFSGSVSGNNNRIHDWAGAANGIGNLVDGKIASAQGNSNVSSSNDGVALGNRTWNGRKYYPDVTSGSEDAGSGLGVLQYVNIPDVEGNVIAYFPNAIFSTEDVTTYYGVGAQKDTLGNIYPSGFTPAVWSGTTLVTANDLTWALHRIAVLKGLGETQIAYITIAKVVYTSGDGTKIYYLGAKPYDTLIGVASSYSPAVDVQRSTGGKSCITAGLFCSSWGEAANASGQHTRAWAPSTRAAGYYSNALNFAADASGKETNATGENSQSANDRTEASGESSNAEGILSVASGTYSKAQNQQTIASGQASYAYNRETEAAASNASAFGFRSKAIRDNQQSYAAGYRISKGDNQKFEIMYSREMDGVGWYELSILNSVEDGKAYHFRTMVLGRQLSGGAGTIGDTFAYEVTGLFSRSGATITTIGTPTTTLIGRSVGMAGDGITTGVRIRYNGEYPTNRVVLRYDGLANTIFYVQSYSTIQEML